MDDIAIFLGRFHPLIVHLPIGFILFAGILELWAWRDRSKSQGLQLPIKIALFSTFASGLIAVGLGFLLASDGAYTGKTLDWHMWMGIAFCGIVFAAWLSKLQILSLKEAFINILIVSAVLAVSITGHLGGNLTHGSDYLTAYAPPFVKRVIGESGTKLSHQSIPLQPDSVLIYTHLIQPFLSTKCYSCHNDEKKKGGLSMTSIASLKKGGDTGTALHPGDSHESSIWKRVIMDPSSEKFMPPKGSPLSYAEVQILQWWIDQAADSTLTAAVAVGDVTFTRVLFTDYGIDISPRPFIERSPIAPIDDAIISKLKTAGWQVRPIAQDIHYLDVSTSVTEVNDEMIQKLRMAKEHITWLDLNNSHLSDSDLSFISKLTNLTKLKLNNNPISDKGINLLSNLKHLEILNLYGTAVSDDILTALKSMSALEKVFIWQTNTTSEGIANMKTSIPKLEIIGGTNG